MTKLRFTITRAMRVVALAVAVLSVAGCARESPEKLIASAKEFLAKGDRSAAVIQLKNLLLVAPDNGEGRLLLGQALLEGEDFASAEKELSRALELRQPQEKVVPLYVQALLAQGKNQEVITEAGRFKLFDPAAVAATQTAVGEANLSLGKAASAKEAFAAALAAVPGYPRARLGNAMIFAAEGQLKDAVAETDAVIAADPKLAKALAFRSELLLAQGERAGARKALEEAIAANDRYLPARLLLIDLLLADGDFDAAASQVNGAMKVAPRDVRVIYLDAVVAFRKGEVDRSRQRVQEVLRFLPDHVQSLVLAGAIAMRGRQYTSAENDLKKALARVPEHAGARQLLIRTYLAMGQPGRAKEVLQPVLQRGMPTNPQWQMLAGDTFLATGDVKQAAEFYGAAAKNPEASADTQQVAARTRLGQAAIAAGRVEEGLRELEAASLLSETDYNADLRLIAEHLRRGEFDKAMLAVNALEKKQPNNPLTFQMYAAVYLAKRDLQAARKSFERALAIEPTYAAAAYNLAQLDLLEKKPEDARKRYEAMIAKSPNNEQLLLSLADLQVRTGAPAKEIQDTLNRAVAANAQSSAARVALIRFLLGTQDAKGALVAAQGALAAMPGDPAVLDAAGVAQETAGEINQAIETYGKLAALQPHAVQPRLRLASLYIRQKDTDKAVEALRRVQKLAPRERDVYPYLVQVYVAAERYEDALREARDLQKREPKFAGGYSLEGDVHFAQRRYDEAERAYRQALKIEPRANVVAAKVHTTLVAAGKRPEADAWARKWIADNPKDASMLLHLGEFELASRNLKASAAHYQAAIGLDPKNVAALNNLAWISGELGDPKALGYAERSLKLAPNNVAVLDTYGMLVMKTGDAQKALPYLERAVKLAPARYDLRLNYAKALMKAGRKEEARKELEALQATKENFKGKDEVAGLLKAV